MRSHEEGAHPGDLHGASESADGEVAEPAAPVLLDLRQMQFRVVYIAPKRNRSLRFELVAAVGAARLGAQGHSRGHSARRACQQLGFR